MLKLDPSGGYVWHTWYGSPGQEVTYSNKLVTDSQSNVHVIGAERMGQSPFNASTRNGSDGQAPLRPYNMGSSNNYYVLKLTGTGAYQWHMFFVSESYGFDLALDAQNNLVMAGTSRTVWNGPVGDLQLQAFKSSAYMIKYSFDLFSVTHLTPGAATAGGGPITLTVTGKKFLDGAVVTWNGVNLTTTFVGSSSLTAVVPANKLLSPGVYAVRVVNPAPEAATSNARYILVTSTVAEVTSQGNSTSGIAAGSATATANGITATGMGSGTVVVARYNAIPGGAVGFSGNTGAYTDVYIAPGSAFTSLSIVNCALNGGNLAYWWNGSLWQAASNQAYSRATGCVTITINAPTFPSLANLTGTPFGTGDSSKKVYLPLIVR